MSEDESPEDRQENEIQALKVFIFIYLTEKFLNILIFRQYLMKIYEI